MTINHDAISWEQTTSRLRAEIERLCGDKIAWQNVAAEYQAEIERLRTDRDEWKQAAGVEAGLRREFLTEIERLRTQVDDFGDLLKQDSIEIEQLRAALKEAGMLVEATAAYYPSIPYKPRLDACLLEIRALEPKP